MGCFDEILRKNEQFTLKTRKHTRKQLPWLTIGNKETKNRNNQSKISDIRISGMDYKTILFTTFKQIKKEKFKNMSRNERLERTNRLAEK